MGNEIAYLMPTKYKIRSQTVLPTIQYGMTPMHSTCAKGRAGSACSPSSVASRICQEGQSEEPINDSPPPPFFPLFPAFSWFSPSFFRFLANFSLSEGSTLSPLPPPPFWWQSGEMSHSGEFKIGGNMESLVEMVQIENSWRNYVNYETGFLELLKH